MPTPCEPDRKDNTGDARHTQSLWSKFSLYYSMAPAPKMLGDSLDLRLKNYNSAEADLKISIRSSPDQGDSRHPILSVDSVPCGPMFVRRQDACCRRKFRAGDFTAHVAWGNFDLGIVADALGFSRHAARHHVKLAVLFSKPHGCGDSNSCLSKGRQRDVFLVMNGRGSSTRHLFILNGAPENAYQRFVLWLGILDGS